MSLVGMLMGQKHRVDVIDIGIDQLLAQIGRGIDHDPRQPAVRTSFDQQRTAAATVFRIVGIALAPAQCGTWDGGRGSAAPNGQRQRPGVDTCENGRKKFSVVWREMSSSETPRVSASTFAIATT